MKGYQLIILLLILALMACGCQKQEASSGEGINESSELDSEPEALTGTVTVYYVSQPDEIRTMWYEKPMALEGVKCFNPSFDVTDHSLLTAIVTDRGIVYPPFDVNLKKLFG